ncbi:MAG: hypothetical protein JRD89_02230 [Deltaproteobacteria bacterium]|nr:hypothetical protein [Deltaproteobacteria bacterium]
MAAEPMTDEGYLREARWLGSAPAWVDPLDGSVYPARLPTSEAVAIQCRRDCARIDFVERWNQARRSGARGGS